MTGNYDRTKLINLLVELLASVTHASSKELAPILAGLNSEGSERSFRAPLPKNSKVLPKGPPRLPTETGGVLAKGDPTQEDRDFVWGLVLTLKHARSGSAAED